jgi:hypothetical protein
VSRTVNELIAELSEYRDQHGLGDADVFISTLEDGEFDYVHILALDVDVVGYEDGPDKPAVLLQSDYED